MKIAILKGETPSATFIEKLITILAGAGLEIILYGKLIKKVAYPNNVRVYAVPNKYFLAILFACKEAFKLYFRNRKLLIKLITAQRRSSKNLYDFIWRFNLVAPVMNHSPDILHIQWVKSIYELPELFLAPATKIVVSLRGSQMNNSPLSNKEIAAKYRELFPQVDGFHAVSYAIADQAIKYGADPSKIKVIYSTVNKDFLDLPLSSTRLNSKLKILSVGRMTWIKGYNYALESMKILKERGFDYHYTLIAGPGDATEELIYQINDSGLNEYVTLIPGAAHRQVLDHMKLNHLLLLPSVEEGIANVVLEAMAVGLPVISTDGGGMPEVVLDGETGLIVPVRDPEAMANKIIEYSRMKYSDIAQMTNKARRKIDADFSSDRSAESFIELFKSVSGK